MANNIGNLNEHREKKRKNKAMSSTQIEKKSLEAHVELCAERYTNLENKLNSLESRMEKFEKYLVDISNKLDGSESGSYKTIITIGTTIIGVLITGIITSLVHFSK
jgi:hypothetical protein